MRYRVMLLGLAVPALLVAQQPDQPAAVPRRRQPRARRRLRVEGRRRAHRSQGRGLRRSSKTTSRSRSRTSSWSRRAPPNPQSERTDPTNVRDMQQQVEDAARVFTLFFDRCRVSLSGSYHAQKPIIETLDRVIGPDDMVGVMTPEMSPASITYSRRTGSIERSRHRHLALGQARSASCRSRPQEEALETCLRRRNATSPPPR